MFGDFRLALRRLLATPLFLAFAVVSLALGVAVPTVVYSVVESLLWKPIGIGQPGTVAVVTAGRSWRAALSSADVDDLRSRQKSFADVAASSQVSYPLSTDRGSQVVDFEAVTGSYFRVVDVKPAVGRMLQAADDEQRAQVIVLSDRVWRRQFDSDPRIVGTIVRVGTQPFEVVGVAPASFAGLTHGSGMNTAAWLPLNTVPVLFRTSDAAAASQESRRFTVLGRLARERSPASGAAEIAAIATGLDREFPRYRVGSQDGVKRLARRDWSTRPISEPEDDSPRVRAEALILALSCLVLVVACTNLSNLMLSRGASRQHEFVVRRALGASRWRLVRELLAESAIIAIAGGVCTVLLTQALLAAASWELPTARGVIVVEPTLSLTAFIVVSVLLVLSLFVFGLEPALDLTRKSVSERLSSEGGAAPMPRARRQRAFIRWQVATSVCFFLVTAVLTKVVVAEALHDSGIALDRLALATVHFKIEGWDESRARRTLDRVMQLAGAHPELSSVALSSGAPFGLPSTPSVDITTPDRPFVKGARATSALALYSSPGIFATFGVPIVRGRPFDLRDDAGSARVVVVSEQAARTLFGTTDAIGRQVIVRGYGQPQATATVVGIAKETDSDRLMSRRGLVVYLPLAQQYIPNLALFARTSGDPAGAAKILQSIFRQADSDLTRGTAGPAFWLLAGPFVMARIGAMLAGALGALTLVLAMVGLYGVQAQGVVHRTREVGVRMALGAARSHIRRMVLREGFRPVVEGLVLGLLVGTLARGWLRAYLLAPIDVVDPVATAIVPIPLGIAAFLACYLPARSAARVDPNVALRHF